ncbi:MAG: hypothetical protein CM15mP51_02690 [Porticoccaceae bacterium]|nr:MAG: hypothetical protein CM15mP51_02690 [Porticoccaceae bacterium]
MWLKLKEILSDKAYLIALLLPFPIWIYFSDLKGINYLSVNEILMLLILFPVTEELFFRGIIQPIIYKKFSKTWRSISVANVLTSLLFSSHIYLIIIRFGPYLPFPIIGFWVVKGSL